MLPFQRIDIALSIDDKQNGLFSSGFYCKILFRSGNTYGVVSVFIITVCFIIVFDTVIVQKNKSCGFQLNAMFFNISSVFLFVVLK